MKSIKTFLGRYVFALICISVVSCDKNENDSVEQPLIISSTGDITASVNAFKQVLGEPLNTTTGKTTGRREINWDGVPDQFMNTSLPKNFFNVTGANDPASQKRGFAYESDGDFRITNANFSSIEPSLSDQFSAFSGTKIFANLSSDLWTVEFEVAGEANAGSIKGFGAVFSDVDLADVSFLEYFWGEKSLGKFFVPQQKTGEKLSFLGVYFADEKITSVQIRHGNGIITPGQKDISNGGVNDIVAMDDFLYNEPERN